MQPNLRLLIWIMLLLGFTSMIYFLSLPAHLPIIITSLIVVAFGYFSFIWFRRHIPVAEDKLSSGDTLRAYIIFVSGIILLVIRAYNEESQYGHWDAWWLWDHHAKYLQDPAYWRELFRLDDEYHPDYPLFVSSLIAFVWRILGNFHMLVPYVFSVFVALVFPCALFLSLYTRSLVVATIAFLMLALNAVYLKHALSFYADQPLGLLFLCAIICLEYSRGQKQAVTIVGALLGCCIWMKNEGLMLSLVFVLFNARTLLANGNYKHFFAGILFPVLTYAFLKLNAPSNDLIKGQNAHTFANLLDRSRYRMVGGFFRGFVTVQTLPITIGAFIYGVYCYTARRRPGKTIFMLITCAAGFAFVYILTPHDLSWHLNTSFDRVLFQLVPSFIYIIARNMSSLRLSVSNEQFQ